MTEPTKVPAYGVVVLTMGTRPDDLDRGLRSLLSQSGVDVDVVVVGNGWEPTGLPEGVRAHALPQNVGIPAGRNAGVPLVKGDLLFFLDDDANLASDDTLAGFAARFAEHPRLGLIQPRVDDPTGKIPPKRWIPRLGGGDPARPSAATTLWEGAIAMRRSVFESFGGWGDEYFYAHEGIELCWRTWDSGHVAWYAGDVPVHHPVINPTRHKEFWRLNARNRVWLAKRNLPWLLAPIYTGTWFILTPLIARDWEAWKAWFNGFVEGWRTPAGDRRAMKWKTVWELTKAGRPPVI